MKKNNIVLIGFMGCGKSTVGKKLAGALSYEFGDTDAMIEETYGKTISQMFAEDGEEYFRTAETELLQKLSAEAKIPCVPCSTFAPKLFKPAIWRSIGRSPIWHPPGVAMLAVPSRASIGPSINSEERSLFASS